MKMPRIMMVEDDENLGFLVKDSLQSIGWQVQLYDTGEKGLTAFHSHSFDLCVLDVMLPEMDGFALAESIRKYNQHVPIIFLTARGQTEDRIQGFHLGADDYVTKPFSIEELKCRLESILRRTAGLPRTGNEVTLNAGNSVLDVQNLTLHSNGILTVLTNKESRLLQLFFRHVDRVIEREVFLKSIWADEGFFVARSMDVFISKLRKYLRHDPSLRIENVRGVGYVMKASPPTPLQRRVE